LRFLIELQSYCSSSFFPRYYHKRQILVTSWFTSISRTISSLPYGSRQVITLHYSSTNCFLKGFQALFIRPISADQPWSETPEILAQIANVDPAGLSIIRECLDRKPFFVVRTKPLLYVWMSPNSTRRAHNPSQSVFFQDEYTLACSWRF